MQFLNYFLIKIINLDRKAKFREDSELDYTFYIRVCLYFTVC